MATKTEIWTASDGTTHDTETAADVHDERAAWAREDIATNRTGLRDTGRIRAEGKRLAEALARWDARTDTDPDEAGDPAATHFTTED